MTGRPSISKPTAWLIRSSPGRARRSAMTARKYSRTAPIAVILLSAISSGVDPWECRMLDSQVMNCGRSSGGSPISPRKIVVG